MNLHELDQARTAFDRAEAALSAHLPHEALEHVEQAIRLDPSNPTTRLLEARIRLRLNQPQLALTALDIHNHLAPRQHAQPGPTLLRAKALAKEGRLELAMGLLERLARQLPDHVRVHRMLAGLAMQLQRIDRAVEALRRVVQMTPGDDASHRLLLTLESDRDPDTALARLLDRLQGRRLPDPRLLLRAARLCRRVGRLREAEDHWRKLLELRPHDQSLWIEAGELADAMGEAALAHQRLSKACRMPGRYRASALAAMATLCMHLGRWSQAAWNWWRLTRLNRHDLGAWAGLLVCAHCAGRARLAHRAQQILVAHSSPQERRAILARLWHHAAAHHALETTSPSDAARLDGPSPLRDLLRLAARSLERAAHKHRDRADVHYHRGVCEAALGNTQTATRSIQQALAINPRYAAALRLLNLLQQTADSKG